MYLIDMPDLNSTSYVILGGLSVEPNLSGYDMRKGIQNSIGYFWGESYGQIYPALKRLASEGLIAPSSSVNEWAQAPPDLRNHRCGTHGTPPVACFAFSQRASAQ